MIHVYDEIRFDMSNQDCVICKVLMRPTILSSQLERKWHSKTFNNGSIIGILESIRSGIEVPTNWPVISANVIKD